MTEALKDQIPDEFHIGDNFPEAATVGELIEQLQRLPKDMLVFATDGPSDATPMVVVFNAGVDDTGFNGPHVSILGEF